jgi:hypothetical protein
MRPIIDVLQLDVKLQSHSRIWLCRTAAFIAIPFPRNSPVFNSPRSLLDICSYTPTISAPVRSRHVMNNRVTPSCVCIGQGQPGAGKGEALLGVHNLVPATANHTTIPADAAALEALQESTLGTPGLSWQAGFYAVLRFSFRRERNFSWALFLRRRQRPRSPLRYHPKNIRCDTIL